MAYVAFIAPDGTPEGPFAQSKVANNLAMVEGEHGMSLDVTNAPDCTSSVACFPYTWATGATPSTGFQFSQISNVSADPMELWRVGDCQDGTTTCYVAGGDGAANNINTAVVQSANSTFMLNFMDIVFGMIKQLGVVDTTAILTRNAHRDLNILLNPAVNHYLIEQYVYPTGLVGGLCNNPIQSTCSWMADWTTFQTGYQTLPVAWSTRGVDFGAEAAAGLSFMTGITVDGYNGLNAYNFYLTSNTQLATVFHNEPQWAIRPLTGGGSSVTSTLTGGKLSHGAKVQ